MTPRFSFGLPPSVGDGDEREAQVLGALSMLGCTAVRTALTYGTLMDDLQSGHLDAAWAPPLVCARMEALGSRVVLRAIRGGAANYRAVFFARKDRGITLDSLAGSTVAWLDQRSMSGFVLPRAHLQSLGLDVDTLFGREKFLGSFPACVTAVLDGKVDVACTFATSAASSRPRLGFQEMAGDRAGELVALGYSAECPNDGILLSPRVQDPLKGMYLAAFSSLAGDAPAGQALAELLQVDGFEVPPEGSYAVLKDVVAASPP